MSAKPKKKRRPREQIEADLRAKAELREQRKREREARRQEKAARRAENELLRQEREAALAEEKRRRDQAAYDAAVAREQKRAEQRQAMMDGIDFICGNDTPGARAVADIVTENAKRVAASQQRAKAAGDPLNLTGHTPPPRPRKLTKKERQQKKKGDGRYVELVINSGQRVTIDTHSNPLASIYKNGGVQAPQWAAAQKFRDDYEAAHYPGIRSRGFDPGVDGGGMAQANLAAVDAQNRLVRLRDSLDGEHWLLLVAVIGRNISFAKIRDAGGGEIRDISRKLRDALTKASIFYGYQARDPETVTMRTLQQLLTEMAAQTGEHVR